MVGKGHVVAQAAVHDGVAVGAGVVLGKIAAPAGQAVVFFVLAHALHRIDALLGPVQGTWVDIGGIQDGALEQAFLAQQDGHRIHLLAGAAASDPDLDRRPGAQQRHHFVAQGKEVARVAEHLADRDRQELQQLHEHARVVQHALLQRRYREAVELAQRMKNPALDRRAGIIAKIIAVLEVDRLNQ
ncbi:hypothetical protein D3C81_1573540 [compost metagenome]